MADGTPGILPLRKNRVTVRNEKPLRPICLWLLEKVGSLWLLNRKDYCIITTLLLQYWSLPHTWLREGQTDKWNSWHRNMRQYWTENRWGKFWLCPWRCSSGSTETRHFLSVTNSSAALQSHCHSASVLTHVNVQWLKMLLFCLLVCLFETMTHITGILLHNTVCVSECISLHGRVHVSNGKMSSSQLPAFIG